ncbi:MAG TPA: replication initiator [Acidimicrobiales bacterium]|nr:replication initiator [Acidimicrobiales bacterium]
MRPLFGGSVSRGRKSRPSAKEHHGAAHRHHQRDGRVLLCRDHHDEADPLLASLPRVDSFNYLGGVPWNAQTSRLRNSPLNQVDRQLAADCADACGDSSHPVRMSSLKVVEFQDGGLVHFHVVLRTDGAIEPFGPPPASLATSSLAPVVAALLADEVVENRHAERPLRGTFTCEGPGYDDPHTREVAEFLPQPCLEARRSPAPTTDNPRGAR